ncbi:protocatechuate 3,4-dioxygenase subunit alpha [Glycomyces buryatensis]|uniref:Protocatechuate 3,4-dioxygenase subunit alpha n=1 Tax=Glycomyces buryatensis TaxID=2570927 RepID=A0A4S8Q035_9ACTN|nr:protocatechuate 3,4-dioxygenase subunit alpha [Glycomyces buryatensis]THV36371.1 protocatechuate 3,4-dioxygenase subunit alpha [Glycomyces buryatensis]
MSVQRLTPSQTLGPFYGFALPYEDDSIIVRDGDLHVTGSVYDGAGQLVPDALIEILQPDGRGRFHAEGFHGFGRCSTRPEGHFAFTTVKPGPVAEGEAPHLAVIVHARGLLLHLHTRMYFADETEANATDLVLNAVPEQRRHTLIGEATEDGVRFDIRLQGENETVFFDV